MGKHREDVEIAFKATNQTGPAIAQLRQGLDSIGKQARGLNQAMRFIVTGGVIGGLGRRALRAAGEGGSLREAGGSAADIARLDKLSDSMNKLGTAIDRVVASSIAAIPGLDSLSEWLNSLARRAGGDFETGGKNLQQTQERLRQLNDQWWHPRNINPLAVNEERRRLEIREAVLKANADFQNNPQVQAAQKKAEQERVRFTGKGDWLKALREATGQELKVPGMGARGAIESMFGGLGEFNKSVTQSLKDLKSRFEGNRAVNERIQQMYENIFGEGAEMRREASDQPPGIAPTDAQYLTMGTQGNPLLVAARDQNKKADKGNEHLAAIRKGIDILARKPEPEVVGLS